MSQLSGNVDEALLDSEGRCVVLEFPAFVLFGVYSPANRDESRIEFRESFVEALEARIRNLIAAGKQVILTGDLNIIRSEMDSSNVAEGLKKEGLSIDEWQSIPTRRILNQLLFDGTVFGDRDEGREQPVLWDICRCYHPTRMGMYTCWDTKRNTRPANVGSRIDYILCSDGIKDWFVESNIQEGLMGSDHCPVYATMSEKVMKDGEEFALAEMMNPESMFRDGGRIRSWEQRDALPLSAKLIPEFDRRQNIRDMFTRKASQTFSQMEQHGAHLRPAGNKDTGPETGASSSATTTGAYSAEGTSCFGNAGTAVTSSASTTARERGNQIKRNPEMSAEAEGPAAKKNKSSSDAKTKVANGQRTLQGFFKPKTIAPSAAAAATAMPRSAVRGQVPGGARTPPPANRTPLQTLAPSPTTPTKAISPGKVFDPIEAKESWSKLLGKRVVPKCEHEEPCISLVTKKPGVNCGMFCAFTVRLVAGRFYTWS